MDGLKKAFARYHYSFWKKLCSSLWNMSRKNCATDSVGLLRRLWLLQEFTNKGTWDALYIDEEMRIIKANEKNLFVLKKISP